MAPKDAAGQTFDFDTIAVVLYAMQDGGIVLGSKHFELMSAIDPKGRTKSSFEHQFRAVKARAKELQAQAQGAGGTPTPTPTPAKAKAKASGGKRKKAASELNGDDDIESTPSKKVKDEPKGDEDEEGDFI